MLVSLLLLFPALMRAETAIQAWVQRYNGTGNNTDSAEALAVDGNNNVIVTGYSWGSGSSFDYATIQYSSGGVPLWTNRYSGPGQNSVSSAVAVDGSNNVIVTGSSGSGTNNDYVTIQYSSAGVPLWTNRYNGPGAGDDRACAVAVDRSNNVMVTGSSGGDYATIQYSSGGVPLWTNRYSGRANGGGVPCSLAVDGSNNVIVTGESSGNGSSDYATIKYSSAGIPLWTNCYNGPRNSIDYAVALAVDGSNNVIVTGVSVGSRGYYDFGTIKYSSGGIPLWTNYYNDPAGTSCYASAVAVDRNNNVVVTGSSYVYGNEDYATIACSSAGVPLWTNRYDGPAHGTDIPRAVTVDDNNNVLVTGYSSGDYATLKYSNAGILLWTNRYKGPGDGGEAWAMVMDRNGDVIVTGESGGGASGFDYATIKFLSSPVIADAQMTNGIFQMRLRRPNTVMIEASTNLVGWMPIFTNHTSTNLLFYGDPDAGSHLRRFYRALRVP
jgi:Beta-propeller repeat